MPKSMRQLMEEMVWRHTPKDYRSVSGGKRSVLHMDKEGTTLSPLDTLPEKTLETMYVSALKLEGLRSRK